LGAFGVLGKPKLFIFVFEVIFKELDSLLLNEKKA
jgi:hypothetical protein